MKKILLETSFSKIYMIIMIIITLLILGGYFSYAMFTVTKEKENAISIVTGNLTYELLIDGEEGNTLTVSANSRKDFIVTLTNPNNRIGRFNFYYLGDLADGVDIGYIEKEGVNTPPSSTGINLEKVDTTGSSNTYVVRVANTTNSSVTINLGVSVGLDYNDLELPSNGHLLRKITSTGTVAEVIEDDIMNRLNYEDSEQTFVTGSNPNNYIWYSGKLWRVVSIDTSDNSVKLVTQWNISTLQYTFAAINFKNSQAEQWLNDTTIDGFLYNLREPEKFIKMGSKWNASTMTDTSKPPSEEEGGTIVEDVVGLLNLYEYNMSGNNNSYLNNNLDWTLLTPSSNVTMNYVNNNGYGHQAGGSYTNYGIRPAINLQGNVKIIDGDGSEDNPYRLEGDNDTNLSGTKLNTRYSGEYLTFGAGENNLYRIVSHETEGLTKITSAEPLKENGIFKIISFGDTVNYSPSNIIGTFLNGEYLTNYVGNNYSNMIEDNTTWYLGNLVFNNYNYKLAKYSNENMENFTSNKVASKIGLLRYGELMTGKSENKASYFLITSKPNINGQDQLIYINQYSLLGVAYSNSEYSIKPALNLKSNVIITGGDGTKEQPFNLALE